MKKANYGDKKNQHSPVVRWEGGISRQSMEDFQGSETILYDITMVDTCLYLCPESQNVQHQCEP